LIYLKCNKEHKWSVVTKMAGGNSVIDDDFDNLEDIDSYSPSVQNINLVISAIAALHVFLGIITILIAYLIFTFNIFLAPLIIIVVNLIIGAILIASIPLYFIIGWAIWSLQPWAWKVSVIANMIFLIINLIGAIVLTALLNIVFLFVLFSSDVKQALAPIDE